MTTSTTTTPIDQSTDAAFRTWVAEIITQLAAVGLTQTADTGQINTSTVTRAAINTAAGYTIWRFSDTLQSTSPVFLKLEFGSASGNTYPQMWVSISTGTNGTGTLNNLAGATPVRFVCIYSASPNSSSYPSYFCCDQSTIGYVGMSWKIGGTNSGASSNPSSSYGGFHLGRSNDSTGASTGNAVFLLSNSSPGGPITGWGTMQCYSYTTTAIYPAASALGGASYSGIYWGIYPLSSSVTLTGGAVQVMPGMMMTPNIQLTQCIGLCSATEIPPGSTFSSALIGSTARTYIQCGSPPGINAPFQNYTSAQVGMFMLWQ